VLVFVAGVKGAGHEAHGLLFQPHAERTNLTLERYDPEVHLTADDGQVALVAASTKATKEALPALPEAALSRQVSDFGAEITSRLASLQDAPGVPLPGRLREKRRHLPHGRRAHPLARPDLGGPGNVPWDHVPAEGHCAGALSRGGYESTSAERVFWP